MVDDKRSFDQAAERSVVEDLGTTMGFGRVMQLCEQIWAAKDPVGALTVGPTASQARLDASIARQLQASIERNSRMATRLQRLSVALPDLDGEQQSRAFKSILNDEEPTW